MSEVLNLLPAYGRRYKTTEEAMHDWSEGKDFKIVQGPYCSIRDSELMRAQGLTHVAITLSPTNPVTMVVKL